MKSDFIIAVTQLAAERHLPKEAVISAIEAALASAYKKDSVLAGQEISVSLNPANGEVKLYTHKSVVKTVEDDQKEISLTAARKHRADAAVDDIIPVEFSIQSTGRIAAQTAKQVVLQRLREAERELVYEEYADKQGEIVTGTVQRADARQVTLDLGRAEAIMPPAEQVPTERYRPGQKVKVFVVEVNRSSRGPEIVVSRSHKDLLKRLFEMEVPEIFNGIVEIKAIAREAGSRSKVAVHSRQDGVDPVGSCVGLRGIRIQNIVNELQGEKIDVVQWNRDLNVFLANALSPCPVVRVEMTPGSNEAVVVVPDRQLSLAIGKEGQNARLCAKLTGFKINIKSVAEAEAERVVRAAELSLRQEDAEPEDVLEEVAQLLPAAQEASAAEGVEEASELRPAAEVQTVPEPGLAVSIEEQLAEASVELETRPQVGAVTASPPEEVVWAAPKVAQEPQRVRFAEDILRPRIEEVPETAPRAKRRRDPKVEEAARPGKRATKRVEYPLESDDELEDMVS